MRCGPARGHPPAPADPGPGDRGRGGGRARDLRAHRPPRPRGARRWPACRSTRSQGRNGGWRLRRRRPDRPERPDRGRGAGAVPGGRAVVGGDARGEGRAAQARPRPARAVPRPTARRRRPRSSSTRAAGTSGPTRPPAPAPRRPAAGRDRGRADRARLRRPRRRASRRGSCTRSASPRRARLVPRGGHRRRAAHVPRRSRHRRSSATGDAVGAARRLRPRRGVAPDHRRGRSPARAVARTRVGERTDRAGAALEASGPACGSVPTAADGRVEVELRGLDAPITAAEIAGYGADVEVLDPPEVRAELAQIANELAGYYRPLTN